MVNIDLFLQYEQDAIIWGRKYTHPKLSRELLDNTALIGLFKAVLSSDGCENFKSYAYRAVCNEILDLIRSEAAPVTRTGHTRPIPLSDTENAEEYNPLNLDDPAISQENKDLYNFCISVLTPFELDIITHIHILNKSQAEYSRTNNIPEATLNRKVAMVYRKLRELTEQD